MSSHSKMVRRFEPGSHRRLATITKTVSSKCFEPRCGADLGEVTSQAEAIEVRRHRGQRTEGGRPRPFHLVGGDPLTLGVAPQGGHDAVQLPGPFELADLTQSQEHPLGALAVHPDRLDQREVGVLLVAPSTHRPFHVHYPAWYLLHHAQSRICRPYILRLVVGLRHGCPWSGRRGVTGLPENQPHPRKSGLRPRDLDPQPTRG